MEDREDDETPGLLPNSYNIYMDCVIESRSELMRLREADGAVAHLTTLMPSLHQTTSMMDFRGKPWELSAALTEKYEKNMGLTHSC